jgi:phenylalanyl-tRNA synthetase beta chain
MLPVIRRNLNFREDNLALFEIGDVYTSAGLGNLPLQRMHLGIALVGMEFPDFWGSKWRARDIFSLKGLIEDLASHLLLGRAEIVPAENTILEKGHSFNVIIGEKIFGCVGRLSSAAAEAAAIKEHIYIAELDFETMSKSTPDVISAKELARFPSADRDIAIVVENAILAKEIESEIRAIGGELIDDVWVFDLYKGKNIPQGKKSLAFGMKFRLPERTLTDDEVNQALAKIVGALERRFGAELRK